MPKVIKGVTYEVFFKIYSKVNQVIYLSLPIYSPGAMALPWFFFFFFFWDI